MPSELRFCRNCGFRLGDGVADYTEPIRFDGQRGPLVPGATSTPTPTKKRRKMSGMTWVFIGLLIFFIGAAAFTAIISPMRGGRGRIVHQVTNKSYAGVREWETAEGDHGVTFEAVSPPGGPADKAGLVGGDVIVQFDGHPVNNEEEMNRLLVQTPPGKTVDVSYLRDGQLKTTKLTTMSEDELNRLSREFDSRPREQRAQLGYDNDEAERVPVAGPEGFGVKLDRIYPSLPADMAGVKDGDIVIKWDDIPIRTPGEFLARVQRAVPYTNVKLTIIRGEERIEIPVKMGRR
jgi:S1-C subfamily serine protease